MNHKGKLPTRQAVLQPNYALDRILVPRICWPVQNRHLKAARRAISGARDQAIFYGDNIVPLMAEIRLSADALENLIADDYWPLPKYREMLFSK